jgi:hypothetical protein
MHVSFFSITSAWNIDGPAVNSASNRNEYQELIK